MTKAWKWTGLTVLTGTLMACEGMFGGPAAEVAASDTDLRPVARVGQEYLYPSDLADIVARSVDAQDSANRAERYVDSWIRKQLMIQAAQEKIDFNEAELERQLLDYRYALMVYQYEEAVVAQQLDSVVAEEEIAAYYEEHPENFELKQNIVQANFLQVSKEAPRLGRLSRLLRSTNPARQKELRDYCYQFCQRYHLEDSLWVNFDELIMNTPFQEVEDKAEFTENNPYSQREDSLYQYYLVIKDALTIGDLSPPEFVNDQIRQIIINQRKLAIRRNLSSQVLGQAKEDEDFEIFR